MIDGAHNLCPPDPATLRTTSPPAAAATAIAAAGAGHATAASYGPGDASSSSSDSKPTGMAARRARRYDDIATVDVSTG